MKQFPFIKMSDFWSSCPNQIYSIYNHLNCITRNSNSTNLCPTIVFVIWISSILWNLCSYIQAHRYISMTYALSGVSNGFIQWFDAVSLQFQVDGWVEQHSHVYMKQSCFVEIHVPMIGRPRARQRGTERDFPVVAHVLDDYYGCLLSAPIRVLFFFCSRW